MDDREHIDLPQDTQKMLSTDGVILGILLGGVLIFWAGSSMLNDVKLLTSAVSETLWVAVYLTMVVAYCGLKMPVFMSHSPRWSTFWLVMFSGHISLFFDSFAVVLLLAVGVTFAALNAATDRYNAFVVKATSAFAALTVGGGFYLGELWGLPWYITNGLNNPIAGLPFLVVLTPYCALLALWCALYHPVRMEKVEFDTKQKLALAEFTVALLAIILTHSPFLCIGLLLVYTGLRGTTVQLVERTAHELTDGAQNALGLILLAVIVQAAGLDVYIQPLLTGAGMFVGAFISSPFAGAMAPPATSLHEFYVGLSYLSLGAPLFVFSSLVAIVVFTDNLHYRDLPAAIKPIAAVFGAKKRGHIQEGFVYTILMVPMVVGLGLLLYLANTAGVFTGVAGLLGIELPN